MFLILVKNFISNESIRIMLFELYIAYECGELETKTATYQEIIGVLASLNMTGALSNERCAVMRAWLK